MVAFMTSRGRLVENYQLIINMFLFTPAFVHVIDPQSILKNEQLSNKNVSQAASENIFAQV